MTIIYIEYHSELKIVLPFCAAFLEYNQCDSNKNIKLILSVEKQTGPIFPLYLCKFVSWLSQKRNLSIFSISR